jgi:glycosyltransferase involved in cell wall biosynthesis
MKILILQKQSDDGCTWYRLTQFAKEANKQGLADVQFVNLNLNEEDLSRIFKEADIFIGRLNPELGMVAEYIKNMGKPLIIDIDDSIDDINPYSDHYSKLGVTEVPDLWKNKEGGFDIEANKKRIEAYKELLKQADVVTTTTLELSEYVKQYNENVAIVPNYIDPDNFPVLNFAPTNQVNLLWSGGSSHFADLWEVKPVIESLMVEYPNLHFYLVGMPHFKSIVKDMPKDRVHLMGWVKPDGHGFRLACLQPHIGICPIVDTKFNKLKSSIKYYELSALGVATIARNIPPYSNDIVDGQTGYLYNDNNQLRTCIEQMILDPINRITMSQNAYKDILKRRNIKTGINDWISLMKGIKDAYSSLHGNNSEQRSAEGESRS